MLLICEIFNGIGYYLKNSIFENWTFLERLREKLRSKNDLCNL